MLKNFFLNTEKIRLALEYGVAIARTAHEQNVELTPELIKRAEEMIINEAKTQSASHMATQFIPNIMSVFELDLSK